MKTSRIVLIFFIIAFFSPSAIQAYWISTLFKETAKGANSLYDSIFTSTAKEVPSLLNGAGKEALMSSCDFSLNSLAGSYSWNELTNLSNRNHSYDGAHTYLYTKLFAIPSTNFFYDYSSKGLKKNGDLYRELKKSRRILKRIYSHYGTSKHDDNPFLTIQSIDWHYSNSIALLKKRREYQYTEIGIKNADQEYKEELAKLRVLYIKTNKRYIRNSYEGKFPGQSIMITEEKSTLSYKQRLTLYWDNAKIEELPKRRFRNNQYHSREVLPDNVQSACMSLKKISLKQHLRDRLNTLEKIDNGEIEEVIFQEYTNSVFEKVQGGLPMLLGYELENKNITIHMSTPCSWQLSFELPSELTPFFDQQKAEKTDDRN